MRLLGAETQQKYVFEILGGKKSKNIIIILAKPSGGVMVESIYFQTCQLSKTLPDVGGILGQHLELLT